MTYTGIPYLKRVMEDGRRVTYVVCRRCGPSPRPFTSEPSAIEGRWWHELKHSWPPWMDGRPRR